MIQSNAVDPEYINEEKLPLRDWILLPLLSLFSICLLVVATDLIARSMYQESLPFIPACLGPVNPEAGAWAPPNSVCWDKNYESRWVEYNFNRCGHRASMECSPKPHGSYRIVMAGSSTAMGALMPREDTFASLLPQELSRRTGRKIELYNEGLVTLSPHALSLRFHEVLDAKPDLFLWILSPYDVEMELQPPPVPKLPPQTNLLAKAQFRLKVALTTETIPGAFQDIQQRALTQFMDSAPGVLIQHILYASQSQYVRSCLMGQGGGAYLKIHLNEQWQTRLRNFDADAAKIEAQSRAAGVPVVAVLIPTRGQAAMISIGDWPHDYSPYKMNDILRSMIVMHRGSYIDILHDYRNTINPEQGFLIVDGHPNAYGHAMISHFLAQELTSGVVPALSVNRSPQPAPAQRR